MTENDARDTEHAAVTELLPWYVNETLSAAERARVRRHLDACGNCRENAALLSRVNAVVSQPTATPILPPHRPERLLAKLDHLERTGSLSWNKPARPAGPAIVVAASLVIAAATLLLLWPDREAGVPEPAVYETAVSGRQPATMDYVMKLEFEPGVRQQDRQRVLRELNAGDIQRGNAGGAYHVNVTLAAASLDELDRFTATVEARPEVRSARIVALQLPVQGEPAGERQ